MCNLVFVHFKSNLIFIQASNVFGAAWHIPEKKKKTACFDEPTFFSCQGKGALHPNPPTLGNPNPPSIGWHDGGSPLDAVGPSSWKFSQNATQGCHASPVAP